MELDDLYNEIAKNDIYVFNYKMKKNKARIIKDDLTFIFLDNSKIHSYTEEKEVIAEELGHYYCEAYYTLSSNQLLIDHQEYRAKKWKALHLCPKEEIRKCFLRGITNEYDIAKELSVDINTLLFAINYYREQGLLYK